MKGKSYMLFVLFIIGLIACEHTEKPKWIVNASDAKQATLADSSKAFVSIFSEKNKKEIQSVGVNYIPFSYPFDPGPVKGLLKVSRIAIRNADLQLTNAQCEVRSFWISKPISKSNPYSILLPVEDIYPEDFLLKGVRKGTDDNEDLFMLINPLNGKEILTYTSAYLDAVVPNCKERRFFGYCSKKNDAGVLSGTDKLMLGTLTYSNSREVIQQFAIFAVNENVLSVIDEYTPDMTFETTNDTYRLLEEGKRLGLMSLDEKSESKYYGGFGIKLNIYLANSEKPAEIKLNVENDKVIISSAVFDKSIFRMEEVK